MTDKKIGFLFDVDGTITTYKGNDSAIDLLIINDLENIRKKGYPIAFVTGRSVDWVQEVFFKRVTPELKEYINIYGEFGLVALEDGRKFITKLKPKIELALNQAIEEITEILCEEKELEVWESFAAPEKRALWIEPKEVMGTFRTLPSFSLTIDVFQKIIKPVLKKYRRLKLEPNPFSADILPKFASKKFGARRAISTLDPKGKIKQWYAFGDSPADKEMRKAKRRKISFTLVTPGETNQLHLALRKILSKK